MSRTDYDVELGGYGFLIESGSMVRSNVSVAIPKVGVSTEDKQWSDFSEIDTAGQKSWHHGRGQFLFDDPAAFLDAEFLDTRVPGQIIPAPLRHTISTDLNGVMVDMIYWPKTAKLYGLVRGNSYTDNKLVEWDNTNNIWVTVTGADTLLQDSACIPTALEIFTLSNDNTLTSTGRGAVATTGEKLLISRNAPGQPATGLSYIYTNDGTTFSASASNPNKAVNFAVWKERLVFDFTNQAIVLRPNPGATTGDTLVTGFGSASEAITNIVAYQDLLIVFKENEAYKVEMNSDGTFSVRPIINYSWARGTDNAKAVAIFQGLLYFNVLSSLYAYNGTSLRSIGPDMGTLSINPVLTADPSGTISIPDATPSFQGLGSAKRGTIKGLAATANWLYASIDGTTTDTVMAYGGTGWHEMTQHVNNLAGGIWFFPALGASGVLAKTVLWFRDGEQSTYLIMSDGTENRYDFSSVDYENVGTPRLITSWFQMSVPEVFKDFLRIKSAMDIASSSTYLTYEFQTEFDSTWYTLGTTFGTDLTFPDNSATAQAVLRAKAIRLRITWTGTSSTCVRFRGYRFIFITRPIARNGWRFVIKAEDNALKLNREPTGLLAEEISRRVEEVKRRPGPIAFKDGREDTAFVNYLKNPGFEGWSSGVPINWAAQTAGGAPTITKNNQYSVEGGSSVKVVAPATQSGIEQLVSLPAGTFHAIFRIWVVSGTVRLQLGSVSLDVAASTPTAGGTNFSRVVVSGNVLSGSGSSMCRVWSTGGAATFYLDNCEVRQGTDDLSPYIAEGEPRCMPTTPGTLHNTTSYRISPWLVYMVGDAENHFEATQTTVVGLNVSRTKTKISVDIREAF